MRVLWALVLTLSTALLCPDAQATAAIPSAAAPDPIPRYASPLPGAPRMLHCSVWSPEEECFYVFGGLAEGGYPVLVLDEVWRYKPGPDLWERLLTGPGPIARYGFGMTWDSKRHLVVVSGGGPAHASNDLWSLDPQTGQWLQLGQPRPPSTGRVYLTLAYDRSADITWSLFGETSDGSSRAYFGYSADSDRWVSQAVASLAMGFRSGHVSAWDSRRRRLLVYGSVYGYLFNSPEEALRYKLVWSGDAKTNEWIPGPVSDLVPETRKHHIGGYDPYLDALIVYGGTVSYYPYSFPNYRPPFVTNELWTYLLEAGRWVRLDLPGLPQRTQAAGGFDLSTGSMVVFGGVDSLSHAVHGPMLATTLVIPIELSAAFSWQGAEGANPGGRARRWGRISGPGLGSEIRNVRLMDRATGTVLQSAERVQRLGTGEWKVAFSRATDEEEIAHAAGRLVVSGVIRDGTRAFLAPIPADAARGGIGAGPRDAEMLEIEKLVPTGPSVVATRESGRIWLIKFRPRGPSSSLLTIVDVSGRVRMRSEGPFHRAPDGDFEFRWNGMDHEGRRLPRGLYLVRVAGAPPQRAGKIILD